MAPSLPKPSRDFVLLRRAEYCERQRASAPAAVSAATMARDKAPVNDGSGSLSFLADCCVPGLLALPCCIGQLVSSQTCNCMPLRPVASVMNRITTYSLQNPSCCCGVAAFTGKWVAYAHGMMFDGVADKRRPYLERAQLFGETFTICGKLVIAGPPALHQELVVGPQNRGPYLGVNNLVLKSLPLDAAGLAIMPLTLPSGDCPMNRGHHRAFRNAMAKYVTNEAALKRGVESDPVVRRALDGLLASGIAPGKCTAKQFTTAILHFLTRTIHYGLLGLDLGDEDCELFTTVYQTQALLLPNILYYSASGPSALCEPCCMPFSSSLFKPKRLERLREIYREALSVQGYRQDPSDPTAPSLSEFADQLVGLIFLAAVNGIKTALFGLLGTKLGLDLLGWGETDVPQGIPRDFALPIDDDEKLRLCVLESIRLAPPVFETMMTLPKPMVMRNFAGSGQDRLFPVGTPLALSYVNSSLDPRVWGESACRFEPYEHAELLWGDRAVLNGFNSVGEHGDRRCPGREFALQLMMLTLRTLASQPSWADAQQSDSQT